MSETKLPGWSDAAWEAYQAVLQDEAEMYDEGDGDAVAERPCERDARFDRSEFTAEERAMMAKDESVCRRV
jgi:hypothetical protein